MTRAKERLYLFTYEREESHFCDELLNKQKSADPRQIPAASASDARAAAIKRTLTSSAVHNASPGFDTFAAKYTVGSQLTHKFFGVGNVISRTGDIVMVEFSNGQQKKLSLQALFQQGLAK